MNDEPTLEFCMPDSQFDKPQVPQAKRKQGFAAMDKAKQRELASRGGKAATSRGTAHKFTAEEAKVAGRLGGLASWQKRRLKKLQAESHAPSPEVT